jgi:predicted amidohydrolase YtcJ
MLVAVVSTTAVAGDNPPPADFVITEARVYTADASRSMAEAIAVRDGVIVYVGGGDGARAFVGPQTKVQRLAGRLVLPGLIDSHIHPAFIVDFDDCDLGSQGKSLEALAAFVRGCIERYKIPAGEWVSVRQWNFSNGNEPDPGHPNLRQALDRASTKHPIQLFGNDGHHNAYNSLALARAKNAAGRVVGLSKATLAEDFARFRNLVGVDESGEPNGTVNEDARKAIGAPDFVEIEFAEVMKAPERVPQQLNSAGITGILDAAVAPELLVLYDTLAERRQLTLRASLAQFYDPEEIKTADGQPDYARMVATATTIRGKYANHPLIRADVVKLFADGVLEGNRYAVPPTLPEAAGLKPYLQPIFGQGKDGKHAVVGYVDTAAPICVEVRQHREQYVPAAASAAFIKEHGYHPDQCLVSSGQLQHERKVILEFVRRFHLAGFALHIHAIGDASIRTAIDAIEAARAEDGVSSQHDALAHLQVIHPDDVARMGRHRLYSAFTYSWMYDDPEYDLSVVPFYDKVLGGDDAALHPADGYYERNAYPVRAVRDAGATLVAGSDAPVFTRDPQPFVNMAMAVTRHLKGRPALGPAQSVPFRDVLDAYTINGAKYLNRDKECGSLEVGKSADFIVVNQDVLALADSGRTDQITDTRVLETWFQGQRVFERGAGR